MKFEQLYPEHTYLDDRISSEFEIPDEPDVEIPNFVIKAPEIGKCQVCNAFTRWMDVRLGQNFCSEECQYHFWDRHINKLKEHVVLENSESQVGKKCKDEWKDIIIVVHDQLKYLKQCITSLMRHTKNCTVYIWNNNSSQEVKDYLDGLMNKIEPGVFEFEIHHNPENAGFIEPNNEMVALGEGSYIILLNSDCVVFEDWDKVMIAHLQQDSDLAEVGYLGGALDASGKGIKSGRYGCDIDFICGFCLCISRDSYEEFGLFNKQLKFAYGEDSDLSLRLKTSGKKILALYSSLVLHYGNKTINKVVQQGTIDTLKETFEYNHKFIEKKWKDYLENDRVLLNKNSETWRGKDSSDDETAE